VDLDCRWSFGVAWTCWNFVEWLNVAGDWWLVAGEIVLADHPPIKLIGPYRRAYLMLTQNADSLSTHAAPDQAQLQSRLLIVGSLAKLPDYLWYTVKMSQS
jgi:hypothetical protein